MDGLAVPAAVRAFFGAKDGAGDRGREDVRVGLLVEGSTLGDVLSGVIERRPGVPPRRHATTPPLAVAMVVCRRTVITFGSVAIRAPFSVEQCFYAGV